MVRIKTDEDIYDSYISAITLRDENFVYFKSGNIRIDLLDKLKKKDEGIGNKLDISGGKITGDLDIEGTIKNNKKTLLDLTYPIGSIYMSIKNTNPSSLFGGTWVAWGSGRVPVGVDTSQTEFASVEKTGGAKTHTLTTAQMPRHQHEVGNYNASGISISYSTYLPMSGGKEKGWPDNIKTNYTGNGSPHNNLQPYITCYMWKRTA